jgi:hypothetical protein
MEGVKGFFDSFKEFIWDIIGYFLPGMYLILLLSVCIKEDFIPASTLAGDEKDFTTMGIIVIGYILGYVIYGFSYAKETLLGRFSYRMKIEEKIKSASTFKDCKELVEKELSAKLSSGQQRNLSVREVRSIAMSKAPEADQKIYTFTFRSELANHIANVSMVISILGLLAKFVPFLRLTMFETSKPVTIIYLYCPG